MNRAYQNPTIKFYLYYFIYPGSSSYNKDREFVKLLLSHRNHSNTMIEGKINLEWKLQKNRVYSQ